MRIKVFPLTLFLTAALFFIFPHANHAQEVAGEPRTVPHEEVDNSSSETEPEEKSESELKSTVQTINWAAVQGASLYRFIIKDEDDDVLAEKELKHNNVSLFLKPGIYYFKVQVINRFKKIAAETDWTLFKVLPSIQPLLRSLSRSLFYDNEESVSLIMYADSISEETDVEILDGFGKAVPVEGLKQSFLRRKGALQIQLHIPMGAIEPGRYSVAVINPSGLRSVLENAVELRKAIAPEPSALSVRAGYNSEVYKGIILTGNRFEEGLTIRLESSRQTRHADMIRLVSSSEAEFSLNLEGLRPGPYRLVVENPSSLTGELSKPFQVLTYDIASLLDFSFGYKIGGYFSPYIEKPEFLYTGSQFRFAFGFGNLAFYNRKFLKDLGVEYELSTWVGVDDANINQFFLLLTGFNLFWQSSFDKPVNVQAKFGTGLTVASMPDGITDGYYTQLSYTPYLKMGVNALVEPVDKLLLDFGAAAVPIFYFDRTVWVLELSVAVGGSL